MITEAPPRAPAPLEPPRPPAPIRGKRVVPAIIAGPLVIIVAATVVFVSLKAAYGGFAHFYQLAVDVPRAGQQMQLGSDVRMRGVRVGQVDGIELIDPRTVRLTLKMEERYRVPASAEAVVSLKTLLGAKFIDLRFPQYRGPFLSDGGEVRTSHVGPELEDALADGVKVLDAINPDDLATVVAELAEGARGHGQDVARGLDATAELSDLFARTLEPQIQALRDLAVTFDALKDRGDELNALADATNQGVPVYASEAAQADLRRALETVAPFARDLADLLILDRESWDRLMDQGDVVLGTIAANPEGLRDLVVGLYRYVFKLGGDPFVASFLRGSAAAGFVNFIGGDDPDQVRQQICAALPDPVKDLSDFCDGVGGP